MLLIAFASGHVTAWRNQFINISPTLARLCCCVSVRELVGEQGGAGSLLGQISAGETRHQGPFYSFNKRHINVQCPAHVSGEHFNHM